MTRLTIFSAEMPLPCSSNRRENGRILLYNTITETSLKHYVVSISTTRQGTEPASISKADLADYTHRLPTVTSSHTGAIWSILVKTMPKKPLKHITHSSTISTAANLCTYLRSPCFPLWSLLANPEICSRSLHFSNHVPKLAAIP